MDKGINLHKELAMGLGGAKKEATGKAPGTDKKKVQNFKKGGLASCKCGGPMKKA